MTGGAANGWRERWSALDTGAASDACDRLGLTGRVVDGSTPYGAPGRFAGRAVTVRLDVDDGRPRPVHLGTRAIEAAQVGDVIVVDHRGRLSPAAWGGWLSLAAKVRGVAGVVVDGAVRDVDEARAVGLPVVARAATPRTARGRVVEGGFNVPVEVGGVLVEPGDLVVADGWGVVVVPAAPMEEVLAAAEQIAARERRWWEAIAGGAPPTVVMGRSYEELVRGEDRGSAEDGSELAT